MEDVIRQIIEIEEKARNIIETTKEENEEKKLEAKKTLKAMEDEIVGSSEKKIRQLRERELQECNDVIEELADEVEQKIKQMEVKAIENEEAWVEFLVTKVLEM